MMMKIIKKILTAILILFTGLFVIGYVFVAVFAKGIIESQIENQLKLKAKIKSVSLGLPLGINIRGLTLGDLGTIERISASPSLLGLFSGRTVLNNLALIKPDFHIQRNADGGFNLPQIPKNKGKPPIIAGLFIEDGALTFSDKKITAEGISFSIKDIDAKIYKATPLPYPLTIKYKLSAGMHTRPEIKDAAISGSGWLDLAKKDMQGNLSILDIDIKFFRDYLDRIILIQQEESAPVDEGRATADFNADLSAEDNRLVIKCGLVRKPGGATMLDFTLRTKLDHPQLNLAALQENIFQNVFEKVAQDPEAAVKAIKDLGEEFKEQGKELEKQFKAIFKKQEE